MKVGKLKEQLNNVPDDYDIYVDVGACYMEMQDIIIDNDDHSIVVNYEEDSDER